MPELLAYAADLAYIHHVGYGDFARQAAPGLLALLAERGIRAGRVVDLGCGSGIWARALTDAGYQAIGVDISPAMIELARQNAPQAEFHVAALDNFPLPECAAVTALGEVLNYCFSPGDPLERLERVCRAAYGALAPGGLLVFDVAEPGRSRGRRQAFSEGSDWTCLVEHRHDEARARLTRRIVTFRQIDAGWRRHEEIHEQQLFHRDDLARRLAAWGFAVQTSDSYGDFRLLDRTVAVIAQKPCAS